MAKTADAFFNVHGKGLLNRNTKKDISIINGMSKKITGICLGLVSTF